MQQQAILREVAHRVFATEFNGAIVELKGDDERAPSYVVTPLGAKMNRVFIVGVLTECENIGQEGREMWRARISDPTGLFTVYAGEYQPEAAEALASLEAPCFVAVVGKARTYEPEPGQLYVSIRPETIAAVDESTRDQWILQTAEHTYSRVKALQSVLDGSAENAAKLIESGVPEIIADGAFLAKEHYGVVDLEMYQRTLLDTLHCLEPGVEVPVHEAPSIGEHVAEVQTAAGAAASTQSGNEALEQMVMEKIQGLLASNPDGAPWDEVIDAGIAANHEEDAVEEALNVLIDKGIVYEPVLGKLKLA